MDGPFRRRLRRRMFYGDKANLDIPSLPLTDLSVEYFRDAVSQKLGHVGLDSASHLIKRNHVSPCSMVLSMIYAKRLKQKNKEYLDSMSSSDVFFISMMMASKYLYDEGVDEEVFNDEWADSTDQDIEDVNELEMNFLKAMDWRLFVRPEEFDDAVLAIEKRLALQEGLKRGWFTYSELDVLTDIPLMSGIWTQVAVECSKLTTLLSAAYVTSVLSMLGSTALAFQLAGPLSTATVALLSVNLAPSLPSLTGQPLQALGGLQDAGPAGKLMTHPNNNNNTLSGEELTHHVWTLLESVTSDSWQPVTSDSWQPVTSDSWQSVTSDSWQPVTSDSWQPVDPGDHPTQERCGGLENDPAGQEVERDNRPSQTSSLWSLLFLDSLLSQLWSVSTEPKATLGSDGLDPQPSRRPISCQRWHTQRRQRMGPSTPPPSVDSISSSVDTNLSSSPSGGILMDSELDHQARSEKSKLTIRNPKADPCPVSLCSQVKNSRHLSSHFLPEQGLAELRELYYLLFGSCPRSHCVKESPTPPDNWRDLSVGYDSLFSPSVHTEETTDGKADLPPLSLAVPIGFHTSLPHTVQAT